jgi:hypothetical protein
LLEAALQSPSVYMSTRSLLVDIVDTVDTVSESSGAVPATEVLVDTAPSPVLTDTIKTPSSLNWRLLAGGLGAVLLILLAFWGANKLNSTGTVSITVSPQTVRTSANDDQLAIPTNRTVEESEPNAVTEFVAVLQPADSAFWQFGDEIQRIPENGRVPFQLPLFFQSSSEPVRLLLPNLVSIVLDTNTALWIESPVPEDPETVLLLTQGRILIESQISSVRVYH